MPTVKDIIIKKPTAEELAKCKTWPIWRKEPSTFDWQYTQQETCLIIEGQVTVSDDSGSINFGPGDLVISPNGLECTWQITKPVTKHYNFD